MEIVAKSRLHYLDFKAYEMLSIDFQETQEDRRTWRLKKDLWEKN